MKLFKLGSLLRVWREWRGFILLICLMVFFRSAIADWNVVPSGSMRPTIVEGDRIWVNKLAYGVKLPFTALSLASWDKPKYGDIVIFYSPENGMRLVKRVVGLPGDTIAMVNNRLYINGYAAEYTVQQQDKDSGIFSLSESLGNDSHTVQLTSIKRNSMNSFGPVHVPAKHYFMLGDNRDNSSDSRVFGFVPRKNIIGRTRTVVLSLDGGNYHFPRKKRFLHTLP